MEKKDRIKAFLKDNFLFGKKDIGDNENLFEAGVIDSFGFVEVLNFIEKDFRVTFDRSAIEIAGFDTINHIAESIERAKR